MKARNRWKRPYPQHGFDAVGIDIDHVVLAGGPKLRQEGCIGFSHGGASNRPLPGTTDPDAGRPVGPGYLDAFIFWLGADIAPRT